MDSIYIALVDTPGFFAGIIRRVIKQDYVHVVLSLDEHINEAYSFGRRNPAIPISAGFEREDKNKIANHFKTAKYLIYKIECTKEQKEEITKKLQEYYRKRFKTHYTLLGLPFILLNRKFVQKDFYTCSSFIAKILEEHKVIRFNKHFSLVTPKDFYEIRENIIYEGFLKDYIK